MRFCFGNSFGSKKCWRKSFTYILCFLIFKEFISLAASHECVFSPLWRGGGALPRHERKWVAEAASPKGDFLAIHLKMLMERKQLGSAGTFSRQAARSLSGEFDMSRHDAFELWVHFQIIVQLFAASVGIYTVRRGLLAECSAPLSQLNKWPLFCSSKRLVSSVCLPWDLFIYLRWLSFSFSPSFRVRAGWVCVCYRSVLFAADPDIIQSSVSKWLLTCSI